MSTDTPEKLIPRHLDPRKLAHQGAVFSGTVPAEAMSRLRDAVVDVHAVTARVEFELGDQNEKLLQGRVSADIELTCQRCLEPFEQGIGSDFVLAAVWNEEEAKQLPGIYDPWVTGEGEGDLYDILDEELLLSLPVVALHQRDCVDHALFSSGRPPENEAESAPNPFQVLKQLKGNMKK